jgi:HEAT repeat protein
MAKGPIQPDRRRPPVPGGARRESVRADLSGLEAVSRRQRLNVRLLEHSCGNDRDVGELRFEDDDLRLLVQIARERRSGTNPLLRRAAVTALGTFQHLEAVETLTRLAASEVEHEGLRGAALVALAGASPSLTPGIVRKHVDDPSPLVRQAAAIALGRSGRPEAAEVLAELVRGEKIAAVRERAAAAAESLGVRVPGATRPRGRRKGTPAVDAMRGAARNPR